MKIRLPCTILTLQLMQYLAILYSIIYKHVFQSKFCAVWVLDLGDDLAMMLF